MSTNKSLSSRTFQGILYPDSASYDCSQVLALIFSTFDQCAYALHDKDVEKDGKLKKPHVHWVGKYATVRTLATQAKIFGLAENDIEPCRNWRKSVRYLIHLDNPEKYQYPPESITADFPLEPYLTDKVEETEKAKKLNDYINGFRVTSMRKAVDYAIVNDCWDALRRGGSIWSACIAENRAYSICRLKDGQEAKAQNLAADIPLIDWDEIADEMAGGKFVK